MNTFKEASNKYNAYIKKSTFGITQLIICLNDKQFRITPMYKSTSSAEGGGEMTCIDFPIKSSNTLDFRIQEKTSFKRTASPKELLYNSDSTLFQIPELDSRFVVKGLNNNYIEQFKSNPIFTKSIINLPSGADIQVKNQKATITVNGFPEEIGFIDTLINISQNLIRFVDMNNAE